jgi:hypothetical protein
VRDYVEVGGLASYGSDYHNVMEPTGGSGGGGVRRRDIAVAPLFNL